LTVASYLTAFVQGARLKTLPVIVVPICMATAWAFYKEQIFHLPIFTFTLISGLFLQMSANFFNDALDYKFGGDTWYRKGPARLSQTSVLPAKTVLKLGFICVALSFITGLFLVFRGGFGILLFGVLSLICSYFYSGYSFSLVKKGLAEVAVFVFFGQMAASLTYYLQTLKWDVSLIYIGLQCGFWAVSILLINYLRDEQEDRASGRKHLVTRYGRSIGLLTLVVLQALIYLLCFYWLDLGVKGGAFAFFLVIPSSVLMYWICTTPASSKYNVFLFCSSLLYMLFGATWILGVLF